MKPLPTSGAGDDLVQIVLHAHRDRHEHQPDPVVADQYQADREQEGDKLAGQHSDGGEVRIGLGDQVPIAPPATNAPMIVTISRMPCPWAMAMPNWVELPLMNDT